MQVKPTQAEIDKLAMKLDELSEVLTENERALLLAVVRIAGQAIAKKAETAAPSGAMTLPKLSDAFKSAFKPGTAAKYEFEGAAQDSVEVSVSWSR